ncbi:hypothetical protein CDD81_7228 [Ophiocordyceps australis]|uniref:PXA domain-containing protein n=1 Tax=Ophiocordyceps australis TaxID=1399860 RepID=A0A2C5Y3V7_9HYPO|nr:hypothetical protein CDD81_7228 [Ophiocordyceps australis]
MAASSSADDAQWSPTTPVSPKTLRPNAPVKEKRPQGVDETHPTIPSPRSADSPVSILATKALDFIATATPLSLLGLAVAFSAVTYAILGRLGLLIIGAVGGVVAFVSLEARNPQIARAVSREKGTKVLDRVWLDVQNTRRIAEAGPDDEHLAIKVLDDLRPETRDALGGLVDAVIRDYVKWWYSPIIPTDHSFPLACRKTLNSYLLAVANRLSRKRPADAFLDLLTNCSSIIIVVMSELAAAFADLPPESNMTAADAVYNYLASNPDSRLANLLNQRQQAAKFKMVAEDLLSFLDQNTQNCDAARVFLREIVANSILETTLQTCSKAEWINGWIVYLLEAGEPDLNQAIDVGMQTARDSGSNVFADIDGNVGNIGIAKPSRPSAESDHSRRKESLGHKRRLSKADEKMEEAVTTVGEAKPEARKRKPRVGELDLSHSSGTGSAKALGGSDHSLAPSWQSDKSLAADNLPLTPRSAMDSSSQSSSPQRTSGSQAFTKFEQIVPEGQGDEEAPSKQLLTLHNATFTLHDEATGDGSKVRSKPTWDYLIQVEPACESHSGWMIVRRYSDFETLHEIVRRIATISGATAFTETHKELPKWKMHSRESLRGELERYLRDACWYASLAESEGMKRFLEKSQGHTHSNSNSKSFGWDSVGKNMLDVLSTAPKGAVEGGRTLVGGVLGNFAGLAKKPAAGSLDMTPSSGRLSISGASIKSPAKSERTSLDSQRSSIISTQPAKMPPMERQPSFQLAQSEAEADLSRSGRLERAETWSASPSALPSREHSRTSSLAPLRSPSAVSLDLLKLPPPPDQMADDYSVPGDAPRPKTSDGGSLHHERHGSGQQPSKKTPATRPSKQYAQLSENETRVAVELLFAIINEMYTLSSAWNIRRTLLTAAKSFLLRPGNPSLLTVQALIQKSLLDANTADAGIAASLRKLRQNSLPTDEELAAWPPGLSADDKERLAVKARKLLIQSGVPAALMGVMGQAATGEALGRVFDCLQIEEVARGLLFGLILQAVRIVTH